MSSSRRKMLTTISQADNNNNNNNNDTANGAKFYLFKEGSLQNGVEITSCFRNSKPIQVSSNKTNIITDGKINLYGGFYQIGEKITQDYPAVSNTLAEAQNKFIQECEKHFSPGQYTPPGYITYTSSTKEEWKGQGGWGFWATSNNYEVVSGGKCTLYFNEKIDFDITKYKTINFSTIDYDNNTENAKGTLILSAQTNTFTPNPTRPGEEQKEDKTLIEFPEEIDGIKNVSLGSDIEGYNAFTFTCNATRGTAYQITEIYLQE